MVLDHWSNDAMVSMDRCGLESESRPLQITLDILKSRILGSKKPPNCLLFSKYLEICAPE